MRRMVLLLLVFASGAVPASNTSMRGTLERVMEKSLTILLPDARLFDLRLPKTAELSAQALVEKFQLGDQIEVGFKPIASYFDLDAELPRMLELTKIKLLKRAEPQDVKAATWTRDWLRPGNLLRGPEVPVRAVTAWGAQKEGSVDPASILEKGRALALAHAAKMPNFIADEIADCYTSPVNADGWMLTSRVQAEALFEGMGQRRRNQKSDGRKVPDGVPFPRCMGWGGGFGSYLRPLFEPDCATKFTYWKKIGRPGSEGFVYRYESPPEGCFPTSYAGQERAYAWRTGNIVLKIPDGELIQVAGRSERFPKAYPLADITEVITWGDVKIGDKSHLLPVGYEKVIYGREGARTRVVAEYSNHRHFEAESNIKFPE